MNKTNIIHIAAWVTTVIASILFGIKMDELEQINTRYGSPANSIPNIIGVATAYFIIPTILWLIFMIIKYRTITKETFKDSMSKKWYNNYKWILPLLLLWPIGLPLLLRRFLIALIIKPENKPINTKKIISQSTSYDYNKITEEKLKVLSDLKEQKLITDEEYSNRVTDTIGKKEIEIKKSKLVKALKLGLLSKEEFEIKIAQLTRKNK